jgi:diguanylate cyclase (GGDEF)-like protein/PAS domain S-box-containing protein
MQRDVEHLFAAHDTALVLALLAAVAIAGVTLYALVATRRAAATNRRLSDRLAAEVTRFRTLADGVLEGVVIHRDGHILDCNPVFRQIVGLAADQAPTQLADYLDAGLLAEIRQAPFEAREVTLRRANGKAFSAEIAGRALRLPDGGEGRLLAIRDISRHKQIEASLNHAALHDQLTDLPNRRLFNEMAEKAASQARRMGHQFAIHTLDLDGFRLVNDMHGHVGGDALLAEVSNRLRACLRDEDVVARFGADEFVVLETGTRQPSDAIIVAQRILDAIARPIRIGDVDVEIGGSIGISVFPDDGGIIDDLLRNADTAMHRAKADGKGTFRFFEATMDAALESRRRVGARLRRAVAEGKLTLAYQPLIDARTQDLLGFEALLRWHDEELGQVPPADFIQVAEETGLIVQLGEFVLHRACADASGWPSPLRVAVNLSPMQFRRPGLVPAVQSALARAGLASNRLDLEITESTLIENREQVLAILQQLKAMQIRISMDDFGTGFSSLSYLQSFPFDKIKVDRSFIADILDSHRNAAIVQAVVAMGNSLSITVVAEGVETPEQARLLHGIGCDELQGFLIARPMPAEEVPAFIARHARESGRSAA